MGRPDAEVDAVLLTIEQREQMDLAAKRWTVVRQIRNTMERLNVAALEPDELAVLIGAIETFADRVHLAARSHGVRLWACPSCDTGNATTGDAATCTRCGELVHFDTEGDEEE